MTNWHSGCYVGEHFWGLPLVKTHSSIPKDTHKCQAVAPDNTWEILSHPNVYCVYITSNRFETYFGQQRLN